MPKLYPGEDEQQRAIERYYEAHKPGSWIAAFRKVMNRPGARGEDTDVERFKKRRLEKKKTDPGYFAADAVPERFSRVVGSLFDSYEAYAEAQGKLPAAEARLAKLDSPVPGNLKPLISELERRRDELSGFVNGSPQHQRLVILGKRLPDLAAAETYYRKQVTALRLVTRQIKAAKEADSHRETIRIHEENFPAGKTAPDPGKTG